ncbi:MAG: glycosyltransferase family 2 protein [Dermatophilaceae bacterium]
MTEATGSGPSFEVVLVAYRSRHHVEDLLDLWSPTTRVALVDNSANVDGVMDLVKGRSNCRYVDGGSQGFARAANAGARESDSDVLVFVNPDSRPTVADLRALVDGLWADPGAASHAALLTDRNGQVEIGVGGWEPTVPRALVHSVGLHKLMPERGLYARPRPDRPCAPDWTTGACMAVRSEVFRRVGGFDELFFVYSEDVSFGRRVRALGYRQVLRHDVVVRHGAGNSGSPSLEMYRLRGASMATYVRTYHRPVRAAGVVAATALGYALRAVAAYPRRPAVARSHAAYLKGLLTRRAWVGDVEVSAARRAEQLVS